MVDKPISDNILNLNTKSPLEAWSFTHVAITFGVMEKNKLNEQGFVFLGHGTDHIQVFVYLLIENKLTYYVNMGWERLLPS
jgi:hypothetical protein